MLAELQSKGPHDAVDPVLSRGVVGKLGICPVTEHRADKHHRAALLADHVGGDRLAALPDASKVDIDHRPPLLVG